MKRAAISYSKLRNELGLCGISVNETARSATVRLARQWKTEDINKVAEQTYQLWKRLDWGETVIEQESGEYLINMLRGKGLPIKVMTTAKGVKDPKELQKIRKMDKIEMTEFLRKMKINKQLLFVKNPSGKMRELESQLPFFSKHTTEAGGIDYYAPGAEPDNLVKALMIACFSCRHMIEGMDDRIVAGPLPDRLESDDYAPGDEFADAFGLPEI